MFNFFSYIIVGFVQGVTELLPISSTAHINLINNIINNNYSLNELDELTLHLSTLIAIFFCTQNIIVKYLKGIFQKDQKSLEMLFKISIAFMPIAVIGGLFGSTLKSIFNEQNAYFGLIIGGIIMMILKPKISNQQNIVLDLNKISYFQAFVIGCSQIIAIVPGVSRLGSTMCTGVLMKLNLQQSFYFSILLMIPTVGAASAHKIYSITKENIIHNLNYEFMIISFLAAFITTIIFFKTISKLLTNNKKSFYILGIYRIIAGILIYY